MFAFGPLHADDLAVCLSAGIGTFLALALLKRAARAISPEGLQSL